MKRIRTFRSQLRLGLAPQLIALIVLVSIASGGLAGIVLTNTSRNAMREQIFRENLSHADLAAQFTSNYIAAVQASARSFASQPALIQAVLTDSPGQMQAELIDLVQTQPALDGASLYDEDGIQRVTSNANKQTIGTSFADREWFHGALITRQPFFGVPVHSRITGHPVESYAIPILDEQGRVRGMLNAGISLGTLSDAILKTLSSSGTRASLNDLRNDGLILAHPDATRIMTPITDKNEAARRMLAGERGAIETTNSTGETDLAVYSQVPGLPWGILILQTRDTALSSIDVMSSQALLITALSILLAILAGTSWTLKVTRPVIRLRDVALQLATGTPPPPLGFTQRDEIGDLGRAFDEMTGILSEKETQLLTWAAKLEQQRNLLRTVIDNLPDHIFAKDRAGAFILNNASHAASLGTTTAAMLDKTDFDYFPPEIAGQFREDDRTVMESGQPLLDDEILSKDHLGNAHWLLVAKVPLRDSQGRCTGIVGISRDITERKRAEESLVESGAKFRALFESSPDAIMLIDPHENWPILDCNEVACRMNGYARDELVGQSIDTLNLTRGSPTERAEYLEKLRLGGVLRLETKHRRKNGTEFSIETSTSLITLGGRQIVLGIDRNIAERKRAEEELAEQHHLLRILIDNLPITIYVKDTASRMLIANNVQARLLGVQTPEEVLGKTDLDFFPEEFARKYIADEQTIIASAQPLIDYEEIVVDRAGNPMWFLSTKVPFWDSQGKIKGIVGIGRDITERKRVEQELIKFRLGIERADDAIFTTTLDGTIDYVNPAFEKTYGYTKEEAIGQTPRIIKSGKLTPEVYRHFWSTLLAKATVVGEIVNKTKDGRLVVVESSANPILDEKGNSVGFLSVQRDVTRRKQAEEKLLREVDKLTALHDVDRALSSTLDLQTCLGIIVDRTRSLFATSSVALMLCEGKQLHMVAQAGLASVDPEVVIPFTGSLTGWSYSQRTSVLVPDVRSDNRYMLYDPRTCAEMAAPLLVQEECIGVLNVESDQIGAFSPADLELLESLAGRAATAIHSVRLLKAEREQRQFSDTLRDFGLALASQRDPDTVLNQLLDLVARVVPYDSGAVVVLEGNLLCNKRQRGYERFSADDSLHKLELPLEQMPNIRQMALTRQPNVVPDTWADPNWIHIEGFRYIRSWVGAPIHVNGGVFGFLSLDKAEPGYYTAEMAERLAAFATQVSLALDNARLYAEQQNLAITDGLTGLANRRHFMELAEREYQFARRHATALSILMIDLDNFKHVNDRYGHAVGDLALQVVAKGLASTVRTIDVVARYGGDEFVVLLPGCGRTEAQLIVGRLEERVKTGKVTTDECTIALSPSIGTAVLNGDENLDSLLIRADAEMYRIKAARKMPAATTGAFAITQP